MFLPKQLLELEALLPVPLPPAVRRFLARRPQGNALGGLYIYGRAWVLERYRERVTGNPLLLPIGRTGNGGELLLRLPKGEVLLEQDGGQSVLASDFSEWLKTQRAEHRVANNKKLVGAARSGDLARIERLLRRGVDVNEQDASGNTPLMAALLAWQYGAAERLLDAQPDLSLCNHLGENALMYAALRNQASIVARMLGMGADVNACNRDGVPVLHFAMVGPHSLAERRGWGSLEVVKLLVAHGADLKGEWQGRSLLQWAEPETDPAILLWLQERY